MKQRDPVEEMLKVWPRKRSRIQSRMTHQSFLGRNRRGQRGPEKVIEVGSEMETDCDLEEMVEKEHLLCRSLAMKSS